MTLAAVEKKTCRGLAKTKARLFRICADAALLDPSMAQFDIRGFRADDSKRQARLEKIGETFVLGYNTALSEPDPTIVRTRLSNVPCEHLGIAFEGAAMGSAVADTIPFSPRDRLRTFLRDAESKHVYLVHVGVGWAMARLPWRRRKLFAMLDPLLCWLAWDGVGFHDVYFSPRRLARIPYFGGYAARAWDQGAGRALWFVSGGNCDEAIRLIQSQDDNRRGDLFAGLGLALTYAGGATDGELEWVREQSGALAAHLAQGAAFAAEARTRANNLTEDTDKACHILCNHSANSAAAQARRTREGLTTETTGPNELPAYEIWRARLRSIYAPSTAGRQQPCLTS